MSQGTCHVWTDKNGWDLKKGGLVEKREFPRDPLLPSENVFKLLKTPQTTFLEGIWIPREFDSCLIFFFFFLGGGGSSFLQE